MSSLPDRGNIDFTPLSGPNHLFPLATIELRARAGFFEYADHLVAGATGQALQAIVGLDLDELIAIVQPRGFGRD